MSTRSTIGNRDKELKGELDELYKLLSGMTQNTFSTENASGILSRIKLVLDKLSRERISDEAIHKQILSSVDEALNLIDKRIAELERLKEEEAPLLFA